MENVIAGHGLSEIGDAKRTLWRSRVSVVADCACEIRHPSVLSLLLNALFAE